MQFASLRPASIPPSTLRLPPSLPPVPTLPVTPGEVAVAFVMAVIGATVQGSIGFGLAVVSAPVLLLIDPIWVPGPMLMGAAVLVMLIAHRDRKHVVGRDVALGTIGRIVGTLPAAYALSVMPVHAYEILFALLILLGVVLSASGWHITPTPGNVVAAATLSGFTGTVSSVGGPPMALVYQNEKGPRVRGTMSTIFIVGTLISLTGLWWAGKFGLVEVMLGLILVPGILVGFGLSHYTAPRLDRAHTRPAILAVSAMSAIVILMRALF